ncbi:MAG: 3-hydroxyacyl-CoA dehydrogenase NAD-binding domain-containing protein [Planctomycetota bacterium]
MIASNRISIGDSISLETTNEGILYVWLDSPNRSVNVLDASMLASLEAVLKFIRIRAAKYRCVAFCSAKETGFFVGADVNAIAELGSLEQAEEVIAKGQDLMTQLADLPIPTVAVIHGACMGGGLELALACDFRIVVDTTATKLALPEIKLGLIPGWGGTQRLPAAVGLQQALTMILTGKTIPAAKAVRIGLADALLEEASFHQTAGAEWIRREILQEFSAVEDASEHVRGDDYRSRPASSLFAKVRRWLLESNPLGRNLVFASARRQIGSRSRHYPALEHAIHCIRASVGTNGQAFDIERRAFKELLFTDTAISLIGLFVARDRARRIPTWMTESDTGITNLLAEQRLPADVKDGQEIQRVAVIGAGAMGVGIGTLAASKGFDVVFKEIHDRAAEAGRQRAENLLQKKVDRGKLKAEEMQNILDRMQFSSDWYDTRDCDLAIEAVLEIEPVKREVFEMLDRSLPAGSTLTSNTSSLCVTRLATATQRREQVAGLHFFNPVDRMDLVEIVQTESTSMETLERSLRFVHRLGKTPIITSDKPGFLVNRVLFPYLGEAIRLVGEGYEIKEIDRQIRSFGMPMGPLELIDQVGVDIAFHVAKTQLDLQPDSHSVIHLLGQMVERGWLGKKSGAGFYQYSVGQTPEPNLSIPVDAIAPKLGLQFLRDGMTKVQRRLIYPMLNEAVHCLDELVVTQAWMVDLGMVLGTGFAPHHGGPLRLIDHIGTETVLANMRELERHYGPRFQPADGLVRIAEREQAFFHPQVETMHDTAMEEDAHKESSMH